MRHFILRLLLVWEAVVCSALNLKLGVLCGGVADLLACRYGLQVVTRCGQQQMLSQNVFVIDGPPVCLSILTSQQEVIMPREV